MGTTALACRDAREASAVQQELPTTAIHHAAVAELFTVRERAQRLVFWRDADNRGPLFTRLHANASTAMLPTGFMAAPDGDPLPVDSVSLGEVQQLFREFPDGWRAFFAQQPGAPGIIELGEVRHDPITGGASVLVGRSCGERCATAWHVELRRDPDWRVISVRSLPLPPESPHVRFVSVERVRLVELDDFTVLDARGRWAYARGHLPGAVRVDWKAFRDGWGRTGRLPGDLASLAGRLGALGVDARRPVLVYGAAADGWGEEGRIAWMLRYLGHPEVLLLDGGIAAWRRAGGALSRVSGAPVPGQFAADPQPDFRVSGDEVAAAVSPGTLVLDTRSEAEWHGSRRYFPKRTGRIPGAVHLHWRDLLAADGTLNRSPAATARLAALGLTDSTTVLAYCVGGVRSAFVTLALRELGVRDVRNYDGSWYEWSADASRRIASPAAAP